MTTELYGGDYSSLFFLMSLGKEDLSQFPEPYRSVNLMRFRPLSWYSNSGEMEKLAARLKPKVIIEIGSWMGASTMHFATLLPPGGKVYAIDTWKGSPNETYPPEILATVYDQFLSNMIHAHLTHIVQPIRMESVAAAQANTVYPDLIYLDATHRYEEVYQDLQAWFPFVKGHGILCGDDWAWGDRGVERAVTQFAKENHLKIYTNGWFWSLHELPIS